MSAESVEFLNVGAVPFALESCRKFDLQPVKGSYDEDEQVWKGADFVAAATATYTQTPGDRDGDTD